MAKQVHVAGQFWSLFPGQFFPGQSDKDWYIPAKPASGSGAFALRLCPAKKGKKFCFRTRVHRVGNQTFQCPKELIDNKWEGDCTICDYFVKRYNDVAGEEFFKVPQKPRFYPGTDEQFRKDLNNIKPIERYYFNVIARGFEERGPLKWSCGKTIYAAILEGIVGNPNNPNVPVLGDVTHPKKGHDLLVQQTIRREGSIQLPDYAGTQYMPTSPMGTTRQINKWLKALHDLDTLRVVRPKEEMMAALEEVFGYLGEASPKQVWRSITDTFEPAW